MRLAVSGTAFVLSWLSLWRSCAAWKRADERTSRVHHLMHEGVDTGMILALGGLCPVLLCASAYQLKRGLTKHGRIERIQKAWAVEALVLNEMKKSSV